MHPQLQALADETQAATERLRRLADRVPAERWSERADPDRWSVGECVAHLNLTSEAYLPLVREGLERARAQGGGAPARYRRDLLGWMIWRASAPGGGMKVKTSASFVPTADQPKDEMVARFHRLQDELLALIRDGDGLPLHRVKVRSAFDPRVSYNLFATLTILPRHQHRHLQQAEGVRDALAPAPASAPG